MKLASFAQGLVLVSLSLGGTGCWLLFPEREEPPVIEEPASGGATPTGTVTPTITDIQVPDFPPLGPDGTIVVSCRDDGGLARFNARFREVHSYPVSGTSAVVEIPSKELGEGFGTLTVQATNWRGASATRAVQNLLIDLSPPEVELETAAVSPQVEGAEVVLWVQDRWVLGEVEFTFRGTRLTHAFPKAYPSTLGTAWDRSRIAFPASELPEGRADAIVIATDAAGNSASFSLPLNVDGTPPRLTMSQPSAGQIVDDTFDVVVTANDGNGDPVQVDVYVGDSFVGSVTGPTATLQVDTATLPSGPITVATVAYDRAGNASPEQAVEVVVP